jgi:hypothetical protein
MSDFTAQGETPASIPYSFASQQYPLDGMTYPATVISVGRVHPEIEGANGVKITAQFTIHHYRQRAADANAEVTALGRLAHLAATIAADHKLLSFNPTIAVELATPGDFSPSQEMATMNNAQQNVSIAHVSLSFSLIWSENKFV